MSVIRCILTNSEIQKIKQSDHKYLKRKLKEHSTLNRMLNKPINQTALHELRCLLDRKPIPGQKPGRFIRGQISRLTDGIKHPCIVRKMTDEERVKYGLEGGAL